MGERLIAFGPQLRRPAHFCQNIILDWALVGRREKRQDARLVVEGEAEAASFVFRYSGEHRSGAEHQPFAGNLHARTARPRIPFLQKFLRWLPPKLRSSTGRIWLGG
jgi:hypothetical protein